MGGKHTKCCCGTPGCEIASDNFNRADANPPSGSWHVAGGEWEVKSNKLKSVLDGPVVTTHRQGKPRGTSYNYYVTAKLITTTATTWAVIAKYTDANTFDWVHFYIDGTGSQILPRFYRRAGGSDTLIMDITTHPTGIGMVIGAPGTPVNVKVCYSEVGWTVEGDDEFSRWTTCDASPASTLPAAPAGLVGFLYGEFDDWTFNYHRLSNLPCPVCDCMCENPLDAADFSCLPETMTLTLHPTVPYTDMGGCTTAGDVVITLRQSNPQSVSPVTYDANPRKLEWFSDVLDFPTSFRVSQWFKLVCVAGELRLHALEFPGNWPFNSSGGFLSWPTGVGTYQVAEVLSCDPLNIAFRDLLVGDHDDGVMFPYCDTLPDLYYDAILTI